MRILILGNDYSAKKFYNFFKKDKENIVFTTISNLANYINFESTQDIVEFCQANDINFVLVIDKDLINEGIQETLSSINITTFAPSIDAIAICSSKSSLSH